MISRLTALVSTAVLLHSFPTTSWSQPAEQDFFLHVGSKCQAFIEGDVKPGLKDVLRQPPTAVSVCSCAEATALKDEKLRSLLGRTKEELHASGTQVAAYLMGTYYAAMMDCYSGEIRRSIAELNIQP